MFQAFLLVVVPVLKFSIGDGAPLTRGNKTFEELMGNPELFGGDMLGGLGVPTLAGEDSSFAGFIQGYPLEYWTNGTVHWSFDTSQGTDFDEAVFNEATKEIENQTCVRFQKRPSDAPKKEMTSYSIIKKKTPTIRITSRANGGCNSDLGMSLWGTNRMNLEYPGCWTKGVIVHELLHALGFKHEHQRYDRDEYITVITDNIIQNRAYELQFRKIPVSETNSVGLQPYNVDSIMHYGWNAYGVLDQNGIQKQTMVYKADPSYKFGSTQQMSASDVAMVKAVYDPICSAPPSKKHLFRRFFLRLFWA